MKHGTSWLIVLFLVGAALLAEAWAQEGSLYAGSGREDPQRIQDGCPCPGRFATL